MVGGDRGVQQLGFAALRPVLVGILLVVDAGIVLLLGIGRHKGWLPPFIGFGMVLLGLIWFMGWSIHHRHDDEPES
ncbi:MAG TPA: hypothetical protein VN522_15280 [Solirubrobacterales bacterium]|nr:hypothetical protein [Solirubrobacterales bacterium]